MAAPSEGQFSDRGLPAPGFVVSGRYRIESLIGEGGMGAVFAARDLDRDVAVAVKVLLPDQLDQRESTKRFTREARAARAIDNAHVARVIDAGELDDGMPFMVLELLVGRSLSALIQDRAPLSVAESVDYLLQACEGVACAHALGIIHRDLKPANLYLAERPDAPPVLKVLDFGIAKATMRLDSQTEGVSLTESSSTLGSPEYMSPEQLRNSKSVGVGTDIWSLGLILHKMLAGRPAFEAETVGEHFAMIVGDDPTPLRQHRPDAPVELEEAIACCLQKSAAGRYRDVAQLAEAIGKHGSADAAEGVARIRAILDAAGASSETGPELSSATARASSSRTAAGSAAVREPADTDPTAPAWQASRTLPSSVRGSSRWLVAAVAIGAAALGVGGYHLVQSETTRAGDGPGVQPSSSAPELGETTGAQPDPTASTEPTETATGNLVEIRLALDPPSARVELDGVVTRDNPIMLPRGERTHVIVASAPGYRSARREVSARRDARVDLKLIRTSAGLAPPRSTAGAAAPSAAAATAAPAPGPTAAPPATSRPKHKGPMVDSL